MLKTSSIGGPTGVPSIVNSDSRLLLTATVIEGDLVSMALSATGDLVMTASTATGLGRVYGVALSAGVSGDIIDIRMSGITQINCEGKNAAGDDLAVAQGSGIVMEASAATGTGRSPVAGDSVCAITGIGQTIASGGASTALWCVFDGANFLGTKHA